MKSLNSLNDLIFSNRKALGIARQNYDVFIEGGTLEPGGMREDENGIRYTDYRYDLALQIENICASRAGILLVMLRNWVDCQKNRDDLGQPSVITTTLSSNKVDVEMTLEVRDPIYIHPDANGPMEIAGQRYAIGEKAWSVAETATLTR